MRDFKNHRLYYFSLVIILMLGLFLIIASSPNRQLQGQFIVAIGICYFIFGVSHHIKNHDMHPKIVVEYALIASLGIACAFFLLKAGFGL